MRIIGNFSSAGKKPDTPTIGTATAGNAQATVAFTAPSYTGKGGTVTYRATSSPGNIQATSTTSPITVTGLSNGTAYTFTVRAETTYGVNSDNSAASNSITPVVPLTVTGGTLTSDATYYYRTFTSNGTLGVSGGTLTADYRLLAGGGSGGRAWNEYNKFGPTTKDCGGGGGGGGAIELGSQTFTAGNYACVIGGGGASGSAGSDSTFNSQTAKGGALGQAANERILQGATAGSINSSGGGGATWMAVFEGSRAAGTGGAGAGTGNAGGNGFVTGLTNGGGAAGGGGGLSAAGSAGSGGSGTGGTGGNGGTGENFFSLGTFYGGGGGGAGGSTGGTGSGGGGNGRASSNGAGTAGGANTGGGGGGSLSSKTSAAETAGGVGGSGILIVRYTRAQVGG